MNKPIYTIESPKENMAELRYTIPLTLFYLKTDADVTALHVAEHCAFGDYNRNEYFQTEVKKLCGGYLEASINKSWVAFHFFFENRYQDKAIKIFKEFTNGFKNKTESKTLKHYIVEVREELLKNKNEYEEMDAARAFLIGNYPYNLSSGGKGIYTDEIKLEKVKKYLSVMADNGITTLTSSKPQLAELKGESYPISKLKSPARINIEIKNDCYLSDELASFLLPKMDEKQSLKLLYSMDYLIHISKVRKLKVLVSNYPVCTILNIFHNGKENLIRFESNVEQIKPAEIKEDIKNSMIEHFASIENVSRFAIANWINEETAESTNVLKNISMILARIKKF